MLRICTFTFFCICLFSLHNTPPQAAEYPQRIISLGPINTENVFLLGAGERLIANTDYCVRPEAAKTKEKIGSVMQFSVEKIIGLEPDLILATGLTRPQQVTQLQAAGIKVVHVRQPKSFAEICSQFLELGQLLGLTDRAKEIIVEAKAKVALVQKMVAGLPKRKVLLQVGSNPLFASIPSSFTNDFISLAGGVNIAAAQQTGTTNYEKVIAANPDVIIVAIMGSQTGTAAKEREKWRNISVISATRNNRIFVINPDIACSPSPSTFAETLQTMASFIHPELDSTPLP